MNRVESFDRLSPAKQKLLLARLKKREEAAGAIPPSPRRAAGGPFPLSFAQRRLWFLGQLDPEAMVYNITQAFHFAGDPSVPAIAAAVAGLVERHEALRTRFAETADGPVQMVIPPFAPAVPEVDLTALPAAARTALAERLIDGFRRAPYRLAEGPHLRALLLRTARGAGRAELVVLFGMHHIIADGWSFALLVAELSALYAAGLAGRPAALPPLAVQYPDFADWQAGRGEALAAELAWWREHLAGAPRVFDLPTDRPRPPAKGEAGRALLFFPSAVEASLDRLAAAAGATRFMVLLAGFGLLLARLTGQGELLVGSPVANRTRLETEGLIGFFVNTVVLRLAPGAGEEAGFAGLVAAARRETLDAYAHQELPFERLVEELNPERDLSRSPLFQVSCSLLDSSKFTLSLPGLAVAPLPLPVRTALYDLELEAREDGGRLLLEWRYDCDLFDRTTVARWARSFDILLAAAAADPGRATDALPLLAEGERHQLLAEWGMEEREGEPPAGRLDALFESQARCRPDAVAIAAPAWALGYGELDARAAVLAAGLAARGVAPGAPVGIALPRSAGMLTALLAILKAGGAYVPLDPAAPADRLAFQLRDALPPGSLVLAEAPLPEVEGVRILAPADLAGAGGPFAPPPRAPELPAYILYTSGSTGRPKGVVVSHGAAASYARAAAARYGLAPSDRFPHVAAPTFDASLDEIFTPWAAGATLLLGLTVAEEPRHHLRDAALLEATFLSLPTAYWHGLAAAVTGADGAPLPPSVRAVVIGGERALPERWFSWPAGGPRLFNSYGPTEAVVGVTLAERGEDPAAALRAETPVGRPLAGERPRVVDRGLRLLPLGVPGELVLGGRGLAQGYLGRPDATAVVFVPDPWSPEPGSRLYRTGDLVRHLPDGRLEVLGRFDFQVKIRGHRIELGEIEAALATHPAVQEAAVVAAGDPASARGLYLAAFVVPRSEAADLEPHLRSRLPEAMIPRDLHFLAALPLTPHGKVDRRELAREAGRLASAAPRAEGEPPRGAVEELLAALWSELLGAPAVARGDDFFALGGHSLLATQLVSRIRRTFGVELPQRALFEDSTLAALAARIEAAGRGEAEDLPPPRAFAGAADGPPPLSFSQERLWLIDNVEPGSNAYNMPVALRLTGPLSAAALAAAWSALAARHPSLRTRFGVRRGVPFQQIEPPAPVPVPWIDLRALPRGAGEAEAARLRDAEAKRPFDLGRDPVLRVALLALAAAEHDLLFTVHHIASDGWSNGVLVREMVALYGAVAAGRPSPLPPLPLSYADYARWQRATVAGPRLQAMVDFFRGELAGLPFLELPTDRPRTAAPPTGGALATVLLPAALGERLRALGRREGVTLFMQLLAAFQAVLGRTAGQADFAVGTPVAGRRFLELEGLIGFFVNTLVLRADLAGGGPEGPTGRELLERVRARALAAFAREDLPFEKLVSELNPERSLAHTPLFQVLCALQNAPEAPVELADLAVAALPPTAVTAKFDLTLSWSETAEGLAGVVEYRPELFDLPTIERLLVRTATFLGGMADDPERPLAALPLLPEAERQAVVVEWNADLGAVVSFDELFFGRRAAAFDAESVALVWDGGDGIRELTRRQLAERFTALARELRRRGVGPGDRVAFCLPRSPEMVTAILAILAAGGAYVPLDPAYPAERIALMLADSGAAVLLTSAALAGRLPPFGGVVLEVEGLALTPSPSPGAGEGDLLREDSVSWGDGSRPWPPPFPDDLAYVCYTSGSTGRPKGVAMGRRALANLLAWQERSLPGPARTLQFAPLSFDVLFQEIGGAWTTGGALVLISEEERRDPEALLAHLERHRVERIHLPFVALRHLAEAAARRPDLSALALRDLVAAGEQLQVSRAVVAFCERLPGCRLHNHYGPTETHAATGLVLAGAPASWPRLPSVGRPLQNARVLLLDPAGEPVGVGVPGELWVGGMGLARGYLDRPEMTAERFLPDPWGCGERLYRTGDRARYLANGEIEYLGRADDQVKIRGIRIEPGEVEAVLAELGLRHAVVVAREDGEVRRLVAYYLEDEGGTAPPAAELRERLGERLPAAYVPAAFLPVAAFPLTASGKADRRALARLPLPEGVLGEPAEGWVPPRGQTEELLAALWSELLGVARVGRADHFFDSGGHSLLASQLIARVREVFGREVPQRALFEEPTLAGLAARIDAAGPAGDLGPLEPAADGPIPLSFAQERLWMLERLNPGESTYNLPLALRLRGRLDVAALAGSLSQVVRRHEPLRTTYRFARTAGSTDGMPVQEIGPAGPPLLPVAIPVVDLSGLPAKARGEEGWWLAFEEAEEPFDLERGPIFRALLLRLTAEEHALLWNVHHIASDGWSNGILVREVTELYTAAREGRAARLSPLRARYADYAAWQRQALAPEVLAGGVEHFRRALAGCRPLALPTDFPRPATLEPAGASHDIHWPPALADGLARLCRKLGATLFMGVAALFSTLLARLTGQGDFAVGTVLAGRGREELEGLIGFFINALPLAVHAGDDPDFATFLARLREVALGAFAHQSVPFERLVEELAPERHAGETPLLQAMCVLQNTPVAEAELPGLTLSPIALETTTAKFDLTLSLVPGEDGLRGGLEYRSGLFTAETIAGWAEALEVLAEAVIADPAQRLSLLPLQRDR